MLHAKFSDVKIMPLYGLILRYGSNITEFRFLESDSTFELTPIRRNTDTGGLRTVAFKIEINAFVMQNNFDEMFTELNTIAREELTEVQCNLRALDDQPAGAAMSIRVNRAIKQKTWYASWEIKQVEYRPRLQVRVGGLFSIDLFEQNNSQGVFYRVYPLSPFDDQEAVSVDQVYFD